MRYLLSSIAHVARGASSRTPVLRLLKKAGLDSSLRSLPYYRSHGKYFSAIKFTPLYYILILHYFILFSYTQRNLVWTKLCAFILVNINTKKRGKALALAIFLTNTVSKIKSRNVSNFFLLGIANKLVMIVISCSRDT